MAHIHKKMQNEKYKISDALAAFKEWAVSGTGKITDDLHISDKGIIQKLIESRAQVLSHEIHMGRGAKLSREVEQTLPCVEVEKVDRAEWPTLPPSGCTWMRTTVPLPSDILVKSVTGVVAGKSNPRFDFIEWDKFQYIATARVPSSRKAKYYSLRDIGDGYYLYLYNEEFLEKLTITGIWSNPIEAAQYPRCGQIDKMALCYPKEVPFHIDRKLTNLIFETTVQVGIPKKAAAPVDIENDDKPANAQIRR